MQDEQKHTIPPDSSAQNHSKGISYLFIHRPVTTVMLSIAIIVLGLVGYNSMGVDMYPNVEFPVVTVQTVLAGSNPEEVETSITKQVEEAVNVISGIDEMSSYSMESASLVIIQFNLEKNADIAAQEVRDNVNKVQKDLPDGIDPPVISKIDIGAAAVLNIVVSADMDIISLTEMAKKKVKENIENVSGIGSVEIVGGREREIHVVVNPLKLASLGIPVSAIKAAIAEQNTEIPGGRVENIVNDFNLRILGRVDKVEDFNDIVIANVNGVPIKISDIGHVEDTGEMENSATYINGKRAVSLNVKKQSGTNTLAVISSIKERLENIKPLLPMGTEITLISDQSSYIEESFFAVMEHLVVGAILAAIVVFLFMGDFRSTIISAIAIPTSIIGTFALMSWSGFTLNNMTLLGLTVAVGLVIDDAIIMLENIHRHMEEYGKTPLQAAIDGSREISFAVIATTAALIVIFVPLAFMTGIVGRFVKSYGLTVAYAVGISCLVALTLTPMLCSKFLKAEKKTKKADKLVDGINNAINSVYIVCLKWAMAHKILMVVFSLLLCISPIFIMKAGLVGVDFIPEDDSGKYQIELEAPDGTSYQTMSAYMQEVERELNQLPYIENLFAGVGVSSSSIVNVGAPTNYGYFIVELEPSTKRGHGYTVFDYVNTTRKMLDKYDNVKSNVYVISSGPGGGQAKVQYVITGPEIDQLLKYANGIYDKVKNVPGIIDLDVDFDYAKPEYRVIIDRDKAHDLGVKVMDIATNLRTFISGEEDISRYKEGDELYEVRIRAEEDYRNNKEVISSMMIPAVQNGKSTLVRLDSVATVEEGVGPSQINRRDRQRQITVKSNIDGKMDLQTAIKLMDKAYQDMHPTAEYRHTLVGQAKEMGRMLTSFLMAFALAILFKYMILAAQFESYTHPLVVLTAIPLTLPFALLTLAFFGESLNIFSLLGIFMLIGIVSKNAILQVDYTNTMRHAGLPKYEAIIEANKVRLRPILMTTVTIIAGMIPTALGTGAGSGLRRSLAIVIIGGQTLSLLITLLMAPVAYSLLDDLGNWLKRKVFGSNDDNYTDTIPTQMQN
ncbi:MAG: efflux RND transporter permease subunit [Elusimicrobiota bacterium]|jgi:HAE1 family hydrophobic/amphiphilic exporter-1|nr:efflux RND transporter permease subunit [Elusimicrobiota bacterium]